MEVNEILERIELGEDSRTQFKVNIRNHTSLAEEMVVPGSAIDDIDSQELRKYYEKEYGDILADSNMETSQILENLYLAKNGQLTLAGLLLFGRKPQTRKPAFMIKAVSFLGTDLYDTVYRDSQDITGNIAELFREGLGFLMRNLHRVQKDKSFNSIGDLEVPKIVLEELLVNALVHRDYFIEAPINLFVFDDRIEIISPGKLPNNLSIENIKYGISVIRNPIITSFAAKLLPYRGIGSGIVRAFKHYKDIELINDPETERFKAIIGREAVIDNR